MPLNWRKLEAWRAHPLLSNRFRHSVPGLGIGFVAFLGYVAYDQMNGNSKASSHH